MQHDILDLPSVRPVSGRRSHFAESKLGFATVALAAGIAACSGDGATGPIADAGVTAKSAPTSPNSDSTIKTSPTPAPTTPGSNVLWVDPSNSASIQADAWRTSRPSDAAQMDKLASKALAKWFGDWNSDIYSTVNAVVTAATNAARVSVLVAYNIPSRDCGGLSGGGGASASAYRTWIGSFASHNTGPGPRPYKAEFLSNFNFGSNYLWTRARGSVPLGYSVTHPARVGLELGGQGSSKNGKSSHSFSVGPTLEYGLSPQLGFVVAGGPKFYDHGGTGAYLSLALSITP